MDRKLRFIGESHHKVDNKGRVSIPAAFRRVLASGDPDFPEGGNPQLVIVYGDDKRNFLECFTVSGIEQIYDKIERLARANPRRKALQRLYSTHALSTAVDETGRLVLPAKLRTKIDLDETAFFASQGETFEIWKPETYDEVHGAALDAEGDFDPDVDASEYLDGDEGI